MLKIETEVKQEKHWNIQEKKKNSSLQSKETATQKC